MTPEARAYQDFVGACRRFWAGPLFRQLRDEAETCAENPELFATRIAGGPTHAYFAWFERHLQRMKYSGRWGLVPVLEAERATLAAGLPAEGDGLTLDPGLALPGYWTDHDIHQHPGGLADEISAFVYREATGQGGVVGQPQLHDRFAALVLKDRPARDIVDLGCGFGRSAVAFARAADAAVTGIDLSASCLRLAACELPEALRGRVAYRQADAANTGLAPESFDLVTSTMLLHEMPAPALEALIAESARLLRPGGTVAHLDFLPPADALGRLLYAGHSARNNEPFMRDLAELDLEASFRRAGFATLRVDEFAERDGALDHPRQAWRLPWTVILATKPLSPEDPA